MNIRFNHPMLSPVIIVSVLLAVVWLVPVEMVGLGVRYGITAVAILGIAGVFVLGSYIVLFRFLQWVTEAAWGDVLERRVEGEDVPLEEYPSRGRIRIAYTARLLRAWISGDFQWVSFEEYYDDMVDVE